MRRLLPGLLLFTAIMATAGRWAQVSAEECDNPGALSDSVKIQQCIGKYNGILDAIAKANSNNQEELNRLKSQVLNLKSQINSLDKRLTELSGDIFDREVKVGVQQELLAARVRTHYIRKREDAGMLIFFSSNSGGEFFRDLAYREKLAHNDQEIIKVVAGEINKLNTQAENMKRQKESTAALKVRVDKQAGAARPDYNPGFSPAFAMFSFGAPHFKGMSQYGAFGRAKNGQNYRQILEAYYGNVEIRKVNVPSVINTSAGTLAFEGNYMKGIAEMPTVWADRGGYEALKAQAVAARSYALAYVGWRINNQNAGGRICTTESCQVYNSGKAGSPGRWGDAVRETEAEILVSRSSGEVVNAWYASTSGGYQESYSALGHTTPGFWDTTSDWTRWADGAWEKKGESPWFYKDEVGGRSVGKEGRVTLVL
ncbi:MAG: SpoIID/LytB domain protein [Candidatus Amesbacteria bacterium GW2011_GWC1_47_15]|uniref:SpoIID/LytB domain protein n=1 Tax=Candidatus Amesbacteria bacterium GW2011_GWC1_47_15 TaxID=1618364 RepID=A0A0G1S1B5_9BACT|nr:MAG: SpoIID/LytB domain protein [Candidatus Amesbacteria bacterium GW2011_GWC1_47_15]